MRLLLDTQIVLWAFFEPTKVTSGEQAALRSPANRLWVSIVTVWEIAIKIGIGKLDVPDDFPALLRSRTDLQILPIEIEHVWHVRKLPQLHRDPFDRLLIAQASIEGLTLMTRDKTLQGYDIPIFGQPARSS